MLSKTIIITAVLLILLAQSFAGRSSANPPQQTLEACQRENTRLQIRLQAQGKQLSTSQSDLGTAREELQRCRTALERAGNTGTELKSVQDKLTETTKLLRTCQEQNTQLQTRNGEMQRRLDDPRFNRDIGALDRELDEKKQQLERCTGLNTTLNRDLTELRTSQATFNEKLKASNDAARDFQTKNGQLSGEVESLKTQLSAQKTQAQSANDELQASKTSVAQLSQQLLSRGQVPANPEGIIAIAEASQTPAPQGQTGQANTGNITVYEENGKVHVIRELVIGTLKIDYVKQVKPENEFPLQAVFKPHPIIAPGVLGQPASEQSIKWFIDLQYRSQKSKVTYNKEQSGGDDEKREIDPRGGEETWSWNVVAPAKFESDLSDLIVYAQYQIGEQAGSQPKDIVHESIKFNQIIEPGGLSRGFAWLKENLTYLLGTITVILGIWATWVKTKKDKLELRLKERESQPTLEPSTGGQVSP